MVPVLGKSSCTGSLWGCGWNMVSTVLFPAASNDCNEHWTAKQVHSLPFRTVNLTDSRGCQQGVNLLVRRRTALNFWLPCDVWTVCESLRSFWLTSEVIQAAHNFPHRNSWIFGRTTEMYAVWRHLQKFKEWLLWSSWYNLNGIHNSNS